MYSAKKVAGKKLYKLARAGKEIARRAADIEIYDIKIIKYEWPDLKILLKCSSGTYIRSLAHDIGWKLGCGAYLNGLRRTVVGDFKIKQAAKIENLNKGNWRRYLVKF